MQSNVDPPNEFQKLTRVYMLLIVGLGFTVVALSGFYLPVERLDLNFLLLSACTVVLGSRILVKIPKLKSHIAVSDTFIFLTFLLYGGEAAVLLAAVEAYVSARRFCSKRLTILFNAAAMALSVGAVTIALGFFGLTSHGQFRGHPGFLSDFFAVLFVMTLVQFLVNTTLAAVYDSMQSAEPLWETWKSKYVWTFFTYLVGSIGAGALVFFIDRAGFGVVFAAIPIILFVFLAYKMYLKNVEMSVAQAEQAELYAQELKERSIALRKSEQRFRSAFNYAPIGIALVAPDGRWLRVNHALSDILGYTADEFLQTDFQSLMYPQDLSSALAKVRSVTLGDTPNFQMENRYVHKNGRTVWTAWSVSASGDLDAEKSTLIFQIQDVTARKLAEEKLHHEATHDSLTGLPNRLFFMGKLAEALEKNRKNPKYAVSVLFIDLDRFKYVNDSLGHLVGDRLLIEIAERLRSCMRPPDVVARLGGDEFVILVEGRYYTEDTGQIAERVQRQLSVPFDLSGQEVYSSASIGILHANDKYSSPEEIMRDADTAMYHAKRSGKARHEIFHENMHTLARETLQLETDLRRAIEDGDLEVLYQPIYQLSDLSIVGVESLARWNHHELGSISPDRFIPLAEEIGWIDALGELILHKACTEMASVLRTIVSGPKPKLSVNLSSRQFARPDFVPRIKQILDDAGFPATSLKLEITESVIIDYQERAVEMLHHLRGLGIDVDIDDFGTGYSNLSYLVRLPISTLKIDRSFVSPITEEGANIEIVRTIIALANNLGLKVVAEGIENEAQLKVLRELGCERGQGFLFARPMGIEEIKSCLSERSAVGILPVNSIDEVAVLSTLQ
jgi:diguanylate cyclase (GGDEF)-like protein/PAS domain S-box-containing protein